MRETCAKEDKDTMSVCSIYVPYYWWIMFLPGCNYGPWEIHTLVATYRTNLSDIFTIGDCFQTLKGRTKDCYGPECSNFV